MVNEEKLAQAIRDRNTDATISALVANGGRVKIQLPRIDPKEIKPGDRFWDFDSDLMRWRVIVITYRRADVIFFREKGKRREDWFPVDSLMTRRLEPEAYVANMDPEYYEVISRSGQVKISYAS
jgi:hypothetical protein